MDPIQVRQALLEVRHLRKSILEKQLFKGYSGRARAAGGSFALVVGMLMQAVVPDAEQVLIFIGWGLVFVVSVLFNYGAVVTWLIREGKQNRTDVSYLLEVVPVWVVGGLLTLALWRQGQTDLLYGCWMCLFGLAQSISRSRLPRRIGWVGLYYMICGSLCLVLSAGSFTQPIIMGLVFFVGEWSAGVIMHGNGHPGGLTSLFKVQK